MRILSSHPKVIFSGVSLMFLIFVSATCTKKTTDVIVLPSPTPVTINFGKAQAFSTTGDQQKLLNNEGGFPFEKKDVSTLPIINLDTTILYQSIDGYGAALTGSSAYNINRLSDADKKTLLTNLFDATTGIGISYLRITMGASDFSLADFTYDDMPTGETDADLKNFSIANDRNDVIPILKLIKTINPSVKIMATPWSAPAWMKTNNTLRGGKLKPENYAAYANYFVKYIQAYYNEGITIDAVTPQNEPLFFTANYPCMDMNAADQTDFIKNNLGPAFKNAGIKTKIIVYDHNWDHAEYPTAILADANAAQFISGAAFHGYGGNVSSMTPVHNAFPSKDLYFTEISGGDWATNFSDNLMWNMSNIFIGSAKNWSKNALLWNLALDEKFGPTNNGCNNCRGVVTINSKTGAVSNNVEYYIIGHFSKFVKQSAKRIASTSSYTNSQLDQVAFLNPDGTKVLIVMNPETNSKNFLVRINEKQLNYTMSAKSVLTLLMD